MNFINVADLQNPNDPEGRSYREVNNSTKHRYEINSLVEFKDGIRLIITKQTRDCDGTPLYCFGYYDDSADEFKTVMYQYPEEEFKVL